MSSGDWAAMSEEDLIEHARAGLQAAMLELFVRHRGLIMGYVVRMTGDRDLGDEVVAATFTTFLGRLPKYRSSGSLAAYLIRIARSRMIDERRARSRLGQLPAVVSTLGPNKAEPVDTQPDPGDRAADAELAARVKQSLDRLSEPLREVVVLRLYEGMDYASIAVAVGAGEATVRSRMRHALNALRRAIEKP